MAGSCLRVAPVWVQAAQRRLRRPRCAESRAAFARARPV